MTSTYVKLSGATRIGLGIKIAATATLGTAIHTTGIAVGTTTIDRVTLWAYNSDTVERELTIEFGGATTPDYAIKATIAPKAGRALVVDGEMLAGDGAAGGAITAFASAANVLTLTGYVQRITL